MFRFLTILNILVLISVEVCFTQSFNLPFSAYSNWTRKRGTSNVGFDIGQDALSLNYNCEWSDGASINLRYTLALKDIIYVKCYCISGDPTMVIMADLAQNKPEFDISATWSVDDRSKWYTNVNDFSVGVYRNIPLQIYENRETKKLYYDKQGNYIEIATGYFAKNILENLRHALIKKLKAVQTRTFYSQECPETCANGLIVPIVEVYPAGNSLPVRNENPKSAEKNLFPDPNPDRRPGFDVKTVAPATQRDLVFGDPSKKITATLSKDEIENLKKSFTQFINFDKESVTNNRRARMAAMTANCLMKTHRQYLGSQALSREYAVYSLNSSAPWSEWVSLPATALSLRFSKKQDCRTPEVMFGDIDATTQSAFDYGFYQFRNNSSKPVSFYFEYTSLLEDGTIYKGREPMFLEANSLQIERLGDWYIGCSLLSCTITDYCE